MSRWICLALLALASPAAAAPLRVVDAKASVELTPLERGRMRLWLATHVDICQTNTQQAAAHGDLTVKIDVAPGRAPRVTVGAVHDMPKAMATCLTRDLARVGFGDLAPRFTWTGTLQLDPDDSIEAKVESLDAKLDDVVVRSTVLAALDPPADCLQRFFTAKPTLSAVLVAKLDATSAQVTEATAGTDGTAACVASLLQGLRWPQGLLHGATLRIWLLRTTTEVDPATPVLLGK